jgi:hypothetical protein
LNIILIPELATHHAGLNSLQAGEEGPKHLKVDRIANSLEGGTKFVEAAKLDFVGEESGLN